MKTFWTKKNLAIVLAVLLVVVIVVLCIACLLYTSPSPRD